MVFACQRRSCTNIRLLSCSCMLFIDCLLSRLCVGKEGRYKVRLTWFGADVITKLHFEVWHQRQMLSYFKLVLYRSGQEYKRQSALLVWHMARVADWHKWSVRELCYINDITGWNTSPAQPYNFLLKVAIVLLHCACVWLLFFFWWISY